MWVSKRRLADLERRIDVLEKCSVLAFDTGKKRFNWWGVEVSVLQDVPLAEIMRELLNHFKITVQPEDMATTTTPMMIVKKGK